jgi:hypothetical protein
MEAICSLELSILSEIAGVSTQMLLVFIFTVARNSNPVFQFIITRLPETSVV